MIIPTRFRSALRPGGSIFEVIAAIGLLAIFASTLFLAIGSQYLATTGTHQSLTALSMAGEGLEAARSIRDSDWASLTTGAHGLVLSTTSSWSFQGASDSSGGFTRVITITDLSANEKQIVSRVSWLNAQGRPRSTSLATNVSNWRNVSAPTILTGDWSNLRTLGTIDLGPGIAGTGVRVRNKIVYMTGTASQSGKDDFFVIDAIDGANPVMAAHIHTGSGLNALDIEGDFAYVAQDSSTNQLQVINISATSSPYAITNFTLTGNSEEALSVAATGTLVLVGTEGGTGSELYLVDVSNPSSPIIKNTLEIGADVNRISILGNRAFLATSSSTKEFIIVNISNPSVPVIAASVDLSGTNAATGLYVNTQDQRAYLTRDLASGVSPEINAYDVTNPDVPTLLGSTEFTYDIPSVFAADSLLFLSTAQSNMEFQLFNATNTQQISFVNGFNFPQVGNDIAFESNMIYIAVRSNDALRILTSQ